MCAALFMAAVLIPACGVDRIVRRQDASLANVDPRAGYLKVHMRDGDMYLLSRWSVRDSCLVGYGERRGPDRELIPMPPEPYRLPFADIALFETNGRHRSPGAAVMLGVGVGSIALTIVIYAVLASTFSGFDTH